MGQPLSNLLELAPVGIIVFNKNESDQWICVQANRLSLDLLKIENVENQNWQDFMPVEAGKIRVGCEEYLFHHQSDKWLGLYLSEEKNQSLMVVIVEQKERQLNIEKIQIQVEGLKNSNKELERFAYVASHDLREPLRKIWAFGERLQKKYGDLLTGDGVFYLDRITDATKRMQTLIDDLLLYSRVTTQQITFSNINLNEILIRTLSDMESKIVKEKAVIVADVLPEVTGNDTQIGQVFQNLISNALKFKKEDVPLRLKIKYAKMYNKHKITFTDNGIGFDPQDADRIFVLFQRLHGRSEIEGTGMGLAICKKIIEKHGGDITATGEKGKCAEFTILLPLNFKNDL